MKRNSVIKYSVGNLFQFTFTLLPNFEMSKKPSSVKSPLRLHYVSESGKVSLFSLLPFLIKTPREICVYGDYNILEGSHKVYKKNSPRILR